MNPSLVDVDERAAEALAGVHGAAEALRYRRLRRRWRGQRRGLLVHQELKMKRRLRNENG